MPFVSRGSGVSSRWPPTTSSAILPEPPRLRGVREAARMRADLIHSWAKRYNNEQPPLGQCGCQKILQYEHATVKLGCAKECFSAITPTSHWTAPRFTSRPKTAESTPPSSIPPCIAAARCCIAARTSTPICCRSTPIKSRRSRFGLMISISRFARNCALAP